MYALQFTPEWNACFEKLDKDIQHRIWKKVIQIEEGLPGRHMKHGLDYYVEEVGQYRICYREFEEKKVRWLHFVGDHKEYEKWVRELR